MRFNKVNKAFLFALLCSYSLLGCSSEATDLERLTIVKDCESVSTRYTYILNGYEDADMSVLFSEDGVWEVLGKNLQGHQAIDNYWQEQSKEKDAKGTLHVLTNQLIEVVDKDNATGSSYITLYVFDKAKSGPQKMSPILVRMYDKYARTAAGWKIDHKRIELIAIGGGSSS